jgi:hypothetical protein
MKILTREQFIEQSEDKQQNYREIWMYQNRGSKRWEVYVPAKKEPLFETFNSYADWMFDNKDRATKRIYIERAEPKDGDTIAVYFSCGAASANAVKKTIQKYGHRCKILVVNNPIKEEDEDNQRFLKDIEKWLGIEIQTAINSKYPECSTVEVWDDRQYMSGVDGAPCTLELKKKARYEWEIKNRPDWTVMGFTKEEKHRFDNFQINERPASIWILEDTTKGECFFEIAAAGIELPRPYRLGMPNANCPCCPKATSPTYWNLCRVKYPEDFKARANQSREIGARLVRYKGKRIFLDELPPGAKGRPIKDMNVECGIFCNIN